MTSERLLVFATTSYAELASAICRDQSRFEAGGLDRRRFPDGETYQRIHGPLEERDVALAGGFLGVESIAPLVARHLGGEP